MAFTWSRNQPVFDPASVASASAAPPDTKTTVGGVLVDLYVYLVANWRQYPQLAVVLPAMSNAVKAYGAGLGGDPFGPVRTVINMIKAERQVDPNLPLP